MRTITKRISLESIMSRLPSIWPSYLNNNTYYFDEESLKERQWQYTSNWGMVPFNIIVNHTPSELGEDKRPKKYDTYFIPNICSDCCHCYGEYVDSSGNSTHVDSTGNDYFYDSLCEDEKYFIISFETFGKWYHFFNDYYDLLKNHGHCGRVYTSAIDYYESESNTKYSNQMIFGNGIEEYLKLDREFTEMGGRVLTTVFHKNNSQYEELEPNDAHVLVNTNQVTIVDVQDEGFFRWLTENVIPSFIMPMKYRDYWNCDKLFYPDVIKWLAWFHDRIEKGYEENAEYKEGTGGELDTWDCKNELIDDCCDCEEYFKRGGKDMYDLMKSWYAVINEKIENNKSIISGVTNCFIPTIILPMELQLSIDDLGEFSIFSKDYEIDTDYRVTRYSGDSNTYGGTVATIDGNSMYLNGGLGHAFDDVYMERYVSSCMTCGHSGIFLDKCPKCGGNNIAQISYDPNSNRNIESGWTSYTDKYIEENKEEFYISKIQYFAYDNDNVKYFTSAETIEGALEDFETQMSKKYLLETSEDGWILIDNTLYDITRMEYGIYDKSNKYLGGKKFQILREERTNTPYTFINGKKVYADFYEAKMKFYFPFFKNEKALKQEDTCSGKTFNLNDYILFDRNKLNEDYVMLCVKYGDVVYKINDASTAITINGIEYDRISGYTLDDSNNVLFLTYNTEIISGDSQNMMEIDSAVVSSSTKYFDGKPFIYVEYPFEIIPYKVDEINGTTVSKLSDLVVYDTLTDDVGNNIEGVYRIIPSSGNTDVYNFQPPEGTELEPLYQVGNVANISRFSKTIENLDDIKDGKNYFVGDIITEMKFYYREYNETIPNETIVTVTLESGDTYSIKTTKGDGSSQSVPSGYTSLNAIKISTSAKTDLEDIEDEVHVFYDDIFCDITYYIGATLKRKEDSPYFNLSYDNGINDHGIEYKETVQFVKENTEYYLSKGKKTQEIIPTKRNDVSEHSISYPIYIYKIKQNIQQVLDSQYDSVYEVPMADFKASINIFSGNGDTYSAKQDMSRHNNMEAFPVFREEYKMGTASIENIDSDIYIDRGINAAFEKHLKLSEVNSLDDLINYGNGFFKVMEN